MTMVSHQDLKHFTLLHDDSTMYDHSPSDPLRGAVLDEKPLSGSRIVFHRQIPVMVDRRPRRLTSDACDATQIITHSIEYLADSRELPNGKISTLDPTQPEVYALLILMEAKYQVYVSCPVIERRKNTLSSLFKGKDRRRPV